MKMLKKEWLSIWKDKKLTLSIVVMFFMPVLYSGMLLWAFWDPYHHLENLPVALVNEDTGAVLEGEEIALGNELISNLLDEKVFNFIEADAKDAEKRLMNQDYYLLIRIPENFSEHATTLLDEKPSKLQIEYVSNEGYNFLSAKIGDSAIEQIREEVNNEVAKTYAAQLYDSITKLGDGYTEAASAALELQDGASKVADGSQEIQDYLYQLASSTVELSDGTAALNEGVKKAADGASNVASGASQLLYGTEQLATGAQSAATGAQSLQQGIEQYTTGVASLEEGQSTLLQGQQEFQEGVNNIAQSSTSLSEGVNRLAGGATSVAQGIKALDAQLATVLAQLPETEAAKLQATLTQLEQGSENLDKGLSTLATNTGELAQGATKLQQSGTGLVKGQEQLAQGVQQLQQNSSLLNEGAQSLQQGNETLAEKIAELSEGTSRLVGGANALTSGLNEAVLGTSKISDGTSQLASKSGELADGSVTLTEGTKKLSDGTGELVTGLSDVGEEASISVSDENIDMTVNPVEIEKTTVNAVDNYGTGLAPYFISLGLFVGALLLTNVYPYVQPAGHPTGLLSWFTSKSSILVVVGLFQVILTTCIMKFGLGLQVESLGLLILTIAISSFAFLAIIQTLTVLMGDVGRFLGLIFLILQLAGSAGTFPLELLPVPLQSIHNWLPMTYSVNAFRAVISSNDYSTLTECLTTLGIIGVVCVAISFAYFALLYKRRYSKPIEQNA